VSGAAKQVQGARGTVGSTWRVFGPSKNVQCFSSEMAEWAEVDAGRRNHTRNGVPRRYSTSQIDTASGAGTAYATE